MSKKRIMIQDAGYPPAFDRFSTVATMSSTSGFTELSEENILQHIANYDGAILGGGGSVYRPHHRQRSAG